LSSILISFSDINIYKDSLLIGNESGLVGYWRLDEESIVNDRRVARDATANNNHLLIQGSVDFVGFNPLTSYDPPAIGVSGGPIDIGVLEQFTEIAQSEIGITNGGTGPLVGYFTDDEDLLNIFGTFFYEPLTGSTAPVSIIANVAGSVSGDIEIYSNDAFPSPATVAFQAEVRSHLWWRLGAAGFASLGQVASSPSALQLDGTRAAVGGGLRIAVNESEGLPVIETGIALNTGDVIAGNIGSERRSKYGFVGHPMNVTSRIEDLTAGGEILISDSTLKKLRGQFRVGGCQELNVKGIDQSIVVHQILGAGHE